MKTLILAVVIGILSLITLHDAKSSEMLRRVETREAKTSSMIVAGLETYRGELFLVKKVENPKKAKELLKELQIETEDGTILYPDEIESMYLLDEQKNTSTRIPGIAKKPSIDF